MKKALIPAGTAALLLGGAYVAHQDTTPALSEQEMREAVLAALSRPQNLAAQTTGDPNAAPLREADTKGAKDLHFTISNEYIERGDAAIDEYPWAIVEPYRDTTFSVRDLGIDTVTVTDVAWEITHEKTGAVESYSGTDITLQFTETGSHSIDTTLSIDFAGTSLDVMYNEKVQARYVRREIRSLTDEDREAYFDAVQTIGMYTDEEGQEIYGEDFRSKDFFIREHVMGGADVECDHWHAGTGFMGTHVMFTAQWEKALQVVNPKVCAAYWDFTIDSESLGYDWRESMVFDPNWFGDAAPHNELRTVTEGRWAYTPVTVDAWNYSDITNAYGLLRSPWNSVNTPYVTRSDLLMGIADEDVPKGCAEYAGCLQEDNWMDLARCFNGDAHGRIHQLMGGSWGTAFADFLASDLIKDTPWSTDPIESFLIETEDMVKLLWRGGYSTCPDYCDLDTSPEECMCECDPSTWQGMTAYEMLDSVDIPRKLYSLDTEGFLSMVTSEVEIAGVPSLGTQATTERVTTYSLNLDDFGVDGTEDEVWTNLMNAICGGGFIGDMYEASSPSDITFWVLHTTMDRLWHWIRLSPQYDERFDETWVDGEYGDEDCVGHYWDDVPMDTFVGVVDDSEDPYTCGEIYSLLSPYNDELPYVYDNFEWAHCEDLGYDMSNDFTGWDE